MSLHGSVVYSVCRGKRTTNCVVLTMHNSVNLIHLPFTECKNVSKHTCLPNHMGIIGPSCYSNSHNCASGGIKDTV